LPTQRCWRCAAYAGGNAVMLYQALPKLVSRREQQATTITRAATLRLGGETDAGAQASMRIAMGGGGGAAGDGNDQA